MPVCGQATYAEMEAEIQRLRIELRRSLDLMETLRGNVRSAYHVLARTPSPLDVANARRWLHAALVMTEEK